MRLWGELIFLVVLVVVVCCAAVWLVSSTIGGSGDAKPKKLAPSEWVASDYTLGSETVVIVELRRPTAKGSSDYETLDKREVARVTNGDKDYDQLYYDAMQNAASRASVLNALHR